MKKILLLAETALLASTLFAYNPPFGGEEMFRLTNPELMSGAASATGGANFTVLPSSIVYNPALPAWEQRVEVDASGTILFNSNKISILGEDSDSSAGFGAELGLMVPTKWFVFTGTTSFLASDFYGMNLRKSIVAHGGASKEISRNLAVGANAYFGYYMGSGADFTVGADVGVLYKGDDFACFKNPRYGFALLNLGKPLSGYETLGIDGSFDDASYPGFLTPRASFAATVFDVSKVKGGFSCDVAVPSFQNFIADFSFGVVIDKLINVSLSWQGNARELAEGGSDGLNVPALGVSMKFLFNSAKIKEKNSDWEQSEIIPSVAYQNLYSGIHAASFGARVNLGLKDTTPPEIIIWNEE